MKLYENINFNQISKAKYYFYYAKKKRKKQTSIFNYTQVQHSHIVKYNHSLFLIKPTHSPAPTHPHRGLIKLIEIQNTVARRVHLHGQYQFIDLERQATALIPTI